MKHILVTVLKTSYAKIVIGAVVAFVAAVCGVYVGFAITGTKSSSRTTEKQELYTIEGQHVQIPAAYFPSFGPGDLFPTIDCEFIDGSSGNFGDLLQGRKSILLFVHFDCGACDRLLYDWHTWAGLNIRSDIQVLLCIGQPPDEIAPSEWDELIDLEVVFVSRHLFTDNFNLVVWPTIICVDQFGLITAIQVGYKDVFSDDVARSLR